MILIRRLFGLALLAAATAAVIVTPLPRAAAEVTDGRFLFNKRCATCHDATALMPVLAKLPADTERRDFLDTFLARHHARDEEERNLIIDYLMRHQPRE